MIRTKVIFKNVIELINTEENVIYKAYVNEKHSERLSFNNFNHFYIDKLLDAKSISFKKN